MTYSWLDMCDVMYQGKIKGMFMWSQNPAGSHPNTNKVVKALDQPRLARPCQHLQQ